MTELTKEAILDYFLSKGGSVKNVDLVRHFKRYLQVEDPRLKEVSRESFKEKVMALATITLEDGEKMLHLKPEYLPSSNASKPPCGRQTNMLFDTKPPLAPVLQQDKKTLPLAGSGQDPPPMSVSSSKADVVAKQASMSPARQSYAVEKGAAQRSLDEFTAKLDAYSSGQVDEIPSGAEKASVTSSVNMVSSIKPRMSSVLFGVAAVGLGSIGSGATGLGGAIGGGGGGGGGGRVRPSSAGGSRPLSCIVSQPSMAQPPPLPNGIIGMPMMATTNSIVSSASAEVLEKPNITVSHMREPSDPGSTTSTGNGTRMQLSTSPLHQASAFLGSGLNTEASSARARSNTTSSVLQSMRRLKSPQEPKPVRPMSGRPHRPSRMETEPVGTSTPPLKKKIFGVPAMPLSTTGESVAANNADEVEDEAVSDGEDEEQEQYGIDPLEKEWMVFASRCNLDNIHRLMMTEPSLINRKDFLFTALHWAAKHGRCDVMSGLLINSAAINVQSGGLTPLHLACQLGHDNAIEMLLERGANANLREHNGRRPIDILNIKVSESIRTMLTKKTRQYGIHQKQTPPNTLATFTRPRTNSVMRRQWSSMEGLSNTSTMTTKKAALSPRMVKRGVSFRKSKKNKLEVN